MTLKSLPLFLSLFVTFLLLDVSAVYGRVGVVGGWEPIKDPKAPEVQEIGEFAVTQHNKQAKTDLKFESVDSGETQVVSGMNYRLVLSAKDGAGSNKYEAVIWDKPWAHFRNLTSFKRI
ncbi:cysteine proteinase inhibitor 1-like [Cornus florida]|uniref:cysteine proteinase inhibitor 1-like n=1 Tax=Cornus florida TaxID=4283 RepID=UPI00289E6D66|nr:cysteine proteinase inhibitor 1-like [Cornus florida]